MMQKVDFSSAGLGVWTIVNVAVIRHESTELNWTRVPFGMNWNGEFFDGSPLRLTWEEASRRFGHGVYLEEKGPTIAMDPEEIARSLPVHGYTRGQESPVIGGITGWRLPTLAEWRTIQFFNSDLFPLASDCYEKVNEQARALFPTLDRSTSYWTATPKWRAHPILRFIGDFLKSGGSSHLVWRVDFAHYVDGDAEEEWPFYLVAP